MVTIKERFLELHSEIEKELIKASKYDKVLEKIEKIIEFHKIFTLKDKNAPIIKSLELLISENHQTLDGNTGL